MILRSRGSEVRIANLTVGQMLGNPRGIGAGVNVNDRTVGGLPAFGRAISIASEAVAKRRLAVWRGEEATRKLVTSTWQARLFSGAPNERQESWFDILESTEASLTGRSNGFWLKANDDRGRVGAVYFIPRERVAARWNRETQRAEYQISVGNGSEWSPWLDASVVMHFRIGHIEPGCIIAPSPVEQYREALKAALSKSRYEGNHYDTGLQKSIAVTFPAEVKPEQARRFRELLQAEHGGVENSSGVRVFGGGATVSEVGLSLADAQFIESMNFDLEQIARMTRVASTLLGGSAGVGSRQTITPEHEEDRWYRYGLEPRLTRIEQRILVDPGFFGPRSRDYPAFLSAQIRADAETESAMLVDEVQAGIRTQNEARAVKGLPPLPGGDVLQFTPVGGAENPPSLTPGSAGSQEATRRQLDALELDAAIERILSSRGRKPSSHRSASEPQYVAVPNIEVHMPEQPAPIVNVEIPAPIVHVTMPEQPAPTVEVNVPAQPAAVVELTAPELPAPIVNVEVPAPVVHVHEAEQTGKRTIKFLRNLQGLIDGAEVDDG